MRRCAIAPETEIAAVASQVPTIEKIWPDGRLTIDPHSYQRRLINSTSPITINLKGWRAGYSSSSVWWLFNTMRACGPAGRAMHYLVLTPTTSVALAGLASYLQRVFCDMLRIGEYKSSPFPKIEINKAGERMLWGHEQPEPSEIHFRYAENPDSFAHYTALAILMDEITQKKFKQESWSVALARVSTLTSVKSRLDGRPLGRIMAGSTVYNLGWTEKLWTEWLRAVRTKWKELGEALRYEENPEMRAHLKADFKRKLYYGGLHPELHFIRFDSTKNPVFDKNRLDLERKSKPDWYVQMRYCARFRRPAGMIFESWEPGKHIYQRTENFNPDNLPSKWPRRVCIDPGSRNFHALFVAYDEERDRHIIYKSWRDSILSNADRAREILRIEPKLEWAVAGQISEETTRIELAGGGLTSVAPRYKDLWEGITAFASAVQLNKVRIFEGVCEGFESEMRDYSRPINEDTGEVKLDEDPEDKDTFHWLDCFRYYSTWHFSSLKAGTTVASGGTETPTRGPEKVRETPSGVVVVQSGFGGGYEVADPISRELDGLQSLIGL